jgi:hypothetical protein
VILRKMDHSRSDRPARPESNAARMLAALH